MAFGLELGTSGFPCRTARLFPPRRPRSGRANCNVAKLFEGVAGTEKGPPRMSVARLGDWVVTRKAHVNSPRGPGRGAMAFSPPTLSQDVGDARLIPQPTWKSESNQRSGARPPQGAPKGPERSAGPCGRRRAGCYSRQVEASHLRRASLGTDGIATPSFRVPDYPRAGTNRSCSGRFRGPHLCRKTHGKSSRHQHTRTVRHTRRLVGASLEQMLLTFVRRYLTMRISSSK